MDDNVAQIRQFALHYQIRMTTHKPLGTIQVDVDDLWVYYESIGRDAREGTTTLIYGQGIPRLLDLFDRYGIRATFFIVGRDVPAQAPAVQEMVRRGHEVANHSTWHRPGFARLTREEKRADIATTHWLITDAAGQPPVGFKSPGFSLSPDQLDVLTELGYLYDSSLLPTFYAPALRSLQRVLSGGHVDPTQYGRAVNGLAPLHPYHPAAAPYRQGGFRASRPAPQWMRIPRQVEESGGRPGLPNLFGHWQSRLAGEGSAIHGISHQLWEAPVTTVPLLRLPMHSTFVLSAGRLLFDLGLALVQARGVPINYLLHAADVVDGGVDPALASYKFLTQTWAEKQPLYEHMLAALSERYELVPTREFLESIM